MSPDLVADELRAAVTGYPLRSYPAVVSTGVAAQAWATEGAPDGAVVVADHQLSPRGHAARPLEHPQGRGLGFSVVVRPALPTEREGWLYTVSLAALGDVLGPEASVSWPDEVRRDGGTVAAVGVRTRVGQEGIDWAVVDVLLPGAQPPRGPVLRAVLEAVGSRMSADTDRVRRQYDGRCETIGRRVRARLRAGTGPCIEGVAVETAADGALVLRIERGRIVPVRPQDVRRLEAA